MNQVELNYEQEAEKLGIRFIGMQSGFGHTPDYPLFQDDKTGSFALHDGETVADALKRMRLKFEVKE